MNGTYTVWLTLTGCPDSEFTCRDGTCLDMEQRCDGTVHCRWARERLVRRRSGGTHMGYFLQER